MFEYNVSQYDILFTLLFSSQIVLYFVENTLVLSFHLDVDFDAFYWYIRHPDSVD